MITVEVTVVCWCKAAVLLQTDEIRVLCEAGLIALGDPDDWVSGKVHRAMRPPVAVMHADHKAPRVTITFWNIFVSRILIGQCAYSGESSLAL